FHPLVAPTSPSLSVTLEVHVVDGSGQLQDLVSAAPKTTLKGAATAPTFSVTRPTVDLGKATVGGVAYKATQLVNTSDVDEVIALDLPAASPFHQVAQPFILGPSYAARPCIQYGPILYRVLHPGDSCTLIFDYNP